jgi:hypothetical protein
MERFFLVYYAAVGKASRYRKREDQVADAYWLVSMLQGVNLISLLMILFVIFSFSISSKIILLMIFVFPLLVNYFIFLKKGKDKIILITDKFLNLSKINPINYILKYVIFTIILIAISGALYSYYKN